MTGLRSWPAVLGALLRRHLARRRRHGLGDGRDHGRRGHAGAAGRVRGRCCGPRARPPPSTPAWSPRCWPTPSGPGRRPAAGRRRHRRRPGQHRQPLHHGGAGRGRRRGPGGQARQPGRVLGVRRRRRAGGARRRDRRCRPTAWPRRVDEAGIGFCFAPVFHPGMRHASAARRELGVPTVFNFLGPLTNPARPTSLAVGCADPRMAPIMAAVLAERGDRRWSSAATTGWTS